jgi:Tripartite tricarboxylate transporter TctB family
MKPVHLALLLALVCGVAAWQVAVIPQSLMQMTVGPAWVPAAVVAALAVLVLLFGLSALKGQQVDESQAPDQSPLPGSGRRMLSLLGGGLAFMVLVVPLGFILAATLCGMGVARAFDAPWGLKSALICASIAAAFWLVFARLLGVGLGPGLPWLI